MLNRIQLNEDIIEFRYNVSDIIKKAKVTKRPMLITQNGKGSVVMIDVNEYERLLETLEITKAVKRAEEDIKAGRTTIHKNAVDKIIKSIK